MARGVGSTCGNPGVENVDYRPARGTKIVKKQSLPWFIVASLAVWASGPVFAQTGFYGGVSLRESTSDATGLKLGSLPLAWNRFASATPVAEDSPQRALFFGGYRWKSDVAVEAALNTTETYALRPGGAGPIGGVGLRPPIRRDVWNADVYTSWEFIRSFSLYGRLGYAQTEARPLFTGASLVPGDARRQRDGVNYGVGLRYDMTQSLGLRVEYSRFGRFAGEGTGTGPLPDSDQLMIGVQFRF
jgi:opacity protein-like surface antigen